MDQSTVSIRPVYPWDLRAVSIMSYANMTGVDPQFTALSRRRGFRLFGRFLFPLYLLLAGRGRKAVVSGQIAGYAFLQQRQLSSVIFNVGVNRPFRRQGIAEMLLFDLEQMVRRRGMPWIALQVDSDNEPARALYKKLAYRSVHPKLWQGDRPRRLADPEVVVERLPLRLGRDLFRHYHHLEMENGEGWAARVLQREYTHIPTNGRYWRCVWRDHEVGCAHLETETSLPILRLLLAQEYWSEFALTDGLLRQLAPPPNDDLEFHLLCGSSGHHAAASEILQQLGFQERERARILMLKRVATE